MSNTNINLREYWFDPTSTASLTASALIAAAISCIVVSSYNLGRLRKAKSDPTYQWSMYTVVCGIVIFFLGLFVVFAYD